MGIRCMGIEYHSFSLPTSRGLRGKSIGFKDCLIDLIPFILHAHTPEVDGAFHFA